MSEPKCGFCGHTSFKVTGLNTHPKLVYTFAVVACAQCGAVVAGREATATAEAQINILNAISQLATRLNTLELRVAAMRDKG